MSTTVRTFSIRYIPQNNGVIGKKVNAIHNVLAFDRLDLSLVKNVIILRDDNFLHDIHCKKIHTPRLYCNIKVITTVNRHRRALE